MFALRVLAAGIVLALVVTASIACGTEPADEEQIEENVAGFFQAIEEEDRLSFCLSITTGSQRALAARNSDDPLTGCVDTVGRVPLEFGVFGVDVSSFEIQSIDVDGDRATVDLGGRRDMRLARIEGDWLVELNP
jgi:hypothetical protein